MRAPREKNSMKCPFLQMLVTAPGSAKEKMMCSVNKGHNGEEGKS